MNQRNWLIIASWIVWLFFSSSFSYAEELTLQEAKEIAKAEKLALHTELREALLAADAKTPDMAEMIIQEHRTNRSEKIVQNKLLMFEIAKVKRSLEEEPEIIEKAEEFENLEINSPERIEGRVRAQEAKRNASPGE